MTRPPDDGPPEILGFQAPAESSSHTTMPPDSNEAAFEKLPQWQPWRAGVALAAILAYILFNSLIRTSSPQRQAGVTQFIESLEAVSATKVAYHQHLSSTGLQNKKLADMQRRTEDDIVSQWKTLAHAKGSHSDTWRRLGIVLTVFGRPGGRDALQHAAQLAKTEQEAKPTASAAKMMETPPRLPARQEQVLWDAIYGARPLERTQTASLRDSLRHLNLGWFEHFAAAALYERARMPAEAEKARADADDATKTLVSLSELQVGILIFGVLALFWFSFRSEARRMLPPLAVYKPLPRSILLITFVSYLAVFVFSSLPLLFLRPAIKQLSSVWVGRLNIGLNLVLQMLVAATTLLILRRLAALAGQRQSVRELVTRLGLYASDPLAAVTFGLLCFAITRPLLLIAAKISDLIFHNFQTPPNPVILWLSTMRSPADMFLVLLLSSVLVPIVEETMFRGMLYPAMRARWGVLAGIVFSSALFAVIHPNLPGGFLPLWTLGALFAIAFQWRGSLVPGIVMHGMNNLLSMLTYYAILRS